MKRPIESDFASHVGYTRALEEYCDSLEKPAQESVAIALNTGTKQGVKWLKNVEHGESLYITPPAAQLAYAEPFGYFKAEPFGWTDCAETDEGARALYEVPPKPAQEQSFCPRCGKRTPDTATIHTCTPPNV